MKISILHLSDLQFGRHHVEQPGMRQPLYQNEDYDSELRRLLDDFDILKKQDIKPNFIVISGDIAEWSKAEEYKQAETFLAGICNHLAIDRRNVILIPGNHDINRKLCQAARLTAEEDKINFTAPYYAKFRNFETFFNNFYANVNWPQGISPYKFCAENLFVIFPFPESKIIFAGLNSCIDESELEPHYGNITVDQLRRANSEINSIDTQKDMLRIAVFHHNFLRRPENDEENLKDANDLQPLFTSGSYKLMLHGHSHISEKGVTGEGNNIIHILATGSAGLDSETLPNNCRRYQVITIENELVRVYRRRFDATQHHLAGRGCWTGDLSPSQNEIYEEFNLNSKKKKKKTTLNYPQI